MKTGLDLAETTGIILLTMAGSTFCSLQWRLPGCHFIALATYTPIAIPVASLLPPSPPEDKVKIYMNSAVSN